MTIKEAKIEYNKLLDRFYKAEKYFDDKNVTQEEKEEQIPNFKKILNNLNVLLSKIGPHTSEETMGGFKIG